MAYVIAEPCVDHQDRSCVTVCPVDCIAADQADRKLYIDPDGCIDCGSCETVCPNQAIFSIDELPEGWRPYARIDVQWYRDPHGAREAVDRLLPLASPAAR